MFVRLGGRATMIQGLLLREFFSKQANKNIKAEVGFERGIRAATVEDIFSQGTALLEGKLAPSERYNVYYTVADCAEEKGRKLVVQHHIPFDVDGIRVEDAQGMVDRDHLLVLAKIICDALQVPFEKCGVLFSGNGIQVIVGTIHAIEDVSYFDQVRHHYGAVCDRIDLRLVQAGLEGKTDRSVWSPARLMRFPDTENRKPGKPVRTGFVMNSVIERVDFDLVKLSGLPDVPTNQQVSQKVVDMWPTPDVRTILDPNEGCKFIHWAQTHPESVTEPEWYAAVSITARFPDGHKFTHKMSGGHPGYSFAETEQKISQALATSGARTCRNINSVSGGKCLGCKHHNTNLVSPIAISGPDHIKSEKTGFYNVYVTAEGETKKGKPDFEGLQRYFSREFKYRADVDAGTIWIWNGKYFTEMSREKIHKYAHDHFDPPPLTSLRNEFYNFVRYANESHPDFFTKSIEGKMNFQNGVFDVKTGILTPHSMEYGFRSVLPCNYDPEAKCPRFDQFMHEVTLGRQPLIELLQEFMGYIFANGDCKHQKALVLLGEGENGKSKLVDLMRALAGRDGFSSISIKDMQREQNRYLTEGKLVNIAEENSKDAFRDTETLKNYVSGGYIQVKKLYAQPYEFQNRTKIVMLCNEPPMTSDASHGFYRRLIMIPFEQTFTDAKGNKDPDILNKLMVELPGIFNWVMEGYRRLDRRNKFSEAAASQELLEMYKRDTDSVRAWAEHALEYSPDSSIELNRQELYDDYTMFCQMNGLSPHSSRRVYAFVNSFIKNKGGIPIEGRKRDGNHRFRTINHLIHLNSPTK